MYNSSNVSLRHRASSASLQQQYIQPSDKQIRRTSLMKPLKRVDPGKKKKNENRRSGVLL
jgi:hypothetical protein